ncbi:phytanoyl-CoA dioxygenase family protein [Pseudonocardia endophytica]|uniref:Ectoine hydroxylase-related dioxygenase (Phytanoyl-CoA dioxygenase family) n=1 Tax=Pseudonocardia endophytica TaxID=401976 RepID=A0A4R1HD14_PSEEN|nr:phytanoyl-CoA dioxygenase family protein [Pseudonocardia endophytica]TCK19924.1 ectoine hydroxylase-related dioxygenase (phytanoyl-CoA dioxygenase family) [Pseudonocardia endophytica]
MTLADNRTRPKVITEEQRDFYDRNGYLVLERIIPDEWLERLRAVTDEMVERSRPLTESDRVFDLEPTHSAEDPRLRRVTSPVDQHPEYWAFASESVIADVAADLVGDDVKFHHSKLNFKWAKGGAEVKWHQDIQFWPHTNYSPLTIGTYLYDCGMEQGPLGVMPGSHEWELYDLYDDQGNWRGALSEEDAAAVPAERTEYLPGPAGSITIHNCRMLHHSAANHSDIGRPLLLNIYSAADAMPYTYNPLNSSHAGDVVRGNPARMARHDPRPCPIPPDWSGGYSGLFAQQQAPAM